MSAPAADPIATLREAITASLSELDAGVREPTLERPPRAELGDYSTNAAMLAAPARSSPPREVAAKLAEGVTGRLGEGLERIEVAGPGFLNLHMSEAWMRAAAAHIVRAGDRPRANRHADDHRASPATPGHSPIRDRTYDTEHLECAR